MSKQNDAAPEKTLASKWRFWWSEYRGVILIVTLFGMIVLLAIAFDKLGLTPPSTAERVTALEKEFGVYLKTTSLALEAVGDSVTHLRTTVDALTDIPPDTKVAAELAGLNEALRTLKTQVEVLHAGLDDSPEKALSVPLLRRDLDALENDLARERDALAGDIERAYDLGKWFLSVFGVALLGLLITNALRRKTAP